MLLGCEVFRRITLAPLYPSLKIQQKVIGFKNIYYRFLDKKTL